MTMRNRSLSALVAASVLLSPASIGAQSSETAVTDGVEVRQVGDDFYCQERRLGTYFYCEKPKPSASEQAAGPSPSSASQLKEITAQLEELKAKAILEPTTENVSAYIGFQREQLDRASNFADVWRRSLWQNPELDYTLQRPIGTLAKRTWTDARTGQRDSALRAISQRYGVFYFYSSACAACEVFAPIMKGVADRFGMTVMAVSMDGGPSAVFPNYLINTGQYQQMGLSGNQVPALVLFDTQTKRPVPIGYGVLTQDEVMDRIFTLTNLKAGSDF